MTQFLLKTFVKDHAQVSNPHVRAAIGKLSGAVGIGANILLFLGKIAVGTMTGSMSVTADALNNLSDASSAIVTLLGFKLAQMPADEDHPYGHARFEYLSGLAVAVMIMLIGFELARSSVEKILNPTAVEFSLVTVLVLVGSVAVKLWLSRFNRQLGDAIQSSTLLATAADSRNDCVATTAVLICGAVEHFFALRIDGIVGLAVAVFILFSGWNLAKETISPLLGEAASPELRSLIVDYIGSQPHVLGYHDLMVHDYGPGQRFATIHVEMDMRQDPLFCHELIDDMERECLRNHNIHLVIHYDPVDIHDPELKARREQVADILKAYDSRLTIHDFRMVRGYSLTNLVFDVALPPDLRGKEKELKALVEDTLNANSSVIYYAVITFDNGVFSQ
jgi:cation diffusion facilitator family transporter